MSRGYPDFSPGAARNSSGVFLPILAESPVWFYEGFDNPTLSWRTFAGTAELIVNDASVLGFNNSYIGGCCLRLTSPTAAQGIIDRKISMPPSSNRIGFSEIIMFDDVSDLADDDESTVPLYGDYQNDDSSGLFGVSYRRSDGAWSVITNPSGDWQIALTKLIPGGYFFHIKLVIDLLTKKYVSLQVSDVIVDISTIEYFNDTSTGTNYLRILALVKGDIGDSGILNIDEVKITYNEV